MHKLIHQLKNGKEALTAQNLSEQLKLPIKLVRILVYELVECKLLAETVGTQPKDPAFIPSKDINQLSIQKITDEINNRGNDLSDITKATVLKAIKKYSQSFSKQFENSDENCLLINIHDAADEN